jgi:hypothetical protein
MSLDAILRDEVARACNEKNKKSAQNETLGVAKELVQPKNDKIRF